jgi:hypothetical protein
MVGPYVHPLRLLIFTVLCWLALSPRVPASPYTLTDLGLASDVRLETDASGQRFVQLTSSGSLISFPETPLFPLTAQEGRNTPDGFSPLGPGNSQGTFIGYIPIANHVLADTLAYISTGPDGHFSQPTRLSADAGRFDTRDLVGILGGNNQIAVQDRGVFSLIDVASGKVSYSRAIFPQGSADRYLIDDSRVLAFSADGSLLMQVPLVRPDGLPGWQNLPDHAVLLTPPGVELPVPEPSAPVVLVTIGVGVALRQRWRRDH